MIGDVQRRKVEELDRYEEGVRPSELLDRAMALMSPHQFVEVAAFMVTDWKAISRSIEGQLLKVLHWRIMCNEHGDLFGAEVLTTYEVGPLDEDEDKTVFEESSIVATWLWDQTLISNRFSHLASRQGQ